MILDDIWAQRGSGPRQDGEEALSIFFFFLVYHSFGEDVMLNHGMVASEKKSELERRIVRKRK